MIDGLIGDILTFIGVWIALGVATLYIRGRAFRRVIASGGTIAKSELNMTWSIILLWPFALVGAIKLFALIGKPKSKA